METELINFNDFCRKLRAKKLIVLREEWIKDETEWYRVRWCWSWKEYIICPIYSEHVVYDGIRPNKGFIIECQEEGK